MKATRKATGKHRSRRGLLSNRWFLWLGASALVVISVAAVLYASNGDDAPKRKLRTQPVVTSEMQVTVGVVDRDFEPRDLTVPVGATVTWQFKGDEVHNVTDDRGAFESGNVRAGDDWSMTFDEAGTFYYYCTLHHVMQATLTVAAAPVP